MRGVDTMRSQNARGINFKNALLSVNGRNRLYAMLAAKKLHGKGAVIARDHEPLVFDCGDPPSRDIVANPQRYIFASRIEADDRTRPLRIDDHTG